MNATLPHHHSSNRRFPKVFRHGGTGSSTFDVKEDVERDRLRPAFLGGKYVSKIQGKSEVSQYILGSRANPHHQTYAVGRRNRTMDLTADGAANNQMMVDDHELYRPADLA